MKLEQAARQALEALQEPGEGSNFRCDTITALRDALAELDIEEMTLTQIAARHEQAEQEPVGIYYGEAEGVGHRVRLDVELPIGTKLYAAPQPVQQEPVAVVEITYGREPECYVTGNIDNFPEGVFKLYAAPVRTKDLTVDEKVALADRLNLNGRIVVIDAVIAKFKEKNK